MAIFMQVTSSNVVENFLKPCSKKISNSEAGILLFALLKMNLSEGS